MRHQKSGLVINHLRSISHIARSIPKCFRGRKIKCVCCGRTSRFLAVGSPLRYDALCKYCGSYERHRLMILWMQQNSAKLEGKKILHFAPEQQIERVVRGITLQYIPANYHPGRGGINIESLDDFADESLDVVICSHVLEHVDDAKALSELSRVLAPNGIALLMFPIIEGWERTLEMSDFGGQELGEPERDLYFGQSDHVRYFGRDVRRRISDVGFSVEEFTAVEPLVSSYGLIRGEKLFIAQKRMCTCSVE